MTPPSHDAAPGHGPAAQPSGTFTSAEHTAMSAALRAAAEGVRGANPVVGAAVLSASGEVLHVGHHRGAGTPHAEVDALRVAREAGTDLRDTTLVVTLEPCHHTGRTGPCSGAILEAGVPRVVYAVGDGTDTARGGAAALMEHGVDVRAGLLAEDARDLNARWFLAQEQRRPFVTLKIAQSLDGRVAAADGTSQWITGETARGEGHALRARVRPMPRPRPSTCTKEGDSVADQAHDTEGVARSQPGAGQPPRPATFAAQVMAEMRKVVQPTREQLITYTLVVMLFVSVIMAFIFGLDQLFKRLMGLVFGA